MLVKRQDLKNGQKMQTDNSQKRIQIEKKEKDSALLLLTLKSKLNQ